MEKLHKLLLANIHMSIRELSTGSDYDRRASNIDIILTRKMITVHNSDYSLHMHFV